MSDKEEVVNIADLIQDPHNANKGSERGQLAVNTLSVGERYLYFAWADATGDLWLMDVASDESE